MIDVFLWFWFELPRDSCFFSLVVYEVYVYYFYNELFYQIVVAVLDNMCVDAILFFGQFDVYYSCQMHINNDFRKMNDLFLSLTTKCRFFFCHLFWIRCMTCRSVVFCAVVTIVARLSLIIHVVDYYYCSTMCSNRCILNWKKLSNFWH